MTTTYHTPHSNPFALTAAAFNAVYSSLDTELVAQDARLDALEAAAPSTDAGICQLRMTLTNGTPVTTADVSGAATLYINRFRGKSVGVYFGGAWLLKEWANAGVSLAALSADTNYDVFIFWDGAALDIVTTAWASATSRATALTTQDGVLVQAGATDRRYLGTIRINATGGQTEDTLIQRYVWNYYNRFPRKLRMQVATDTWAYTTAAWRQWNADTTNKVEYVCGWEEDPIIISLDGMAFTSSGVINASIGVGIDSTTTNSADIMSFASTSASFYGKLRAQYEGFPGVGYHAINMLEWGGANGSFAGDGGSAQMQNGLVGRVAG